MRVIIPRPFSASDMLVNVDLLEQFYQPGTYTKGTRRYILPSYDLYEVVASPSTTDSPTVGYAKDPKTWDRVGKINGYAAFDGIIGNKMTGANLDMTIESNGTLTNGIAFFGVSAPAVRITVTDPVDGEVYDRTVSLIDNSGIQSWYDWYFAPIVTKQDCVLTDLPMYPNASIRVRITGAFSVGEMAYGRVVDLGTTGYGTQVGILDFSRKERDTFGNAVIIQRAFANLVTYSAVIQTSRVSYTRQVLSALRATPAVYIGSESHPETIVYGYFRDLTITLAGPSVSDCNLEVEGLV